MTKQDVYNEAPGKAPECKVVHERKQLSADTYCVAAFVEENNQRVLKSIAFCNEDATL